MSFPYFKYLEIENQEWIDSDFFKKTETKFLFVVYQMNKNETSVKLQKVFFWDPSFGHLFAYKSEKGHLKRHRKINVN